MISQALAACPALMYKGTHLVETPLKVVSLHYMHTGHWAQDCPKKAGAAGNAGGGGGSSSAQGHRGAGTPGANGGSHVKADDVCFKCGQQGKSLMLRAQVNKYKNISLQASVHKRNRRKEMVERWVHMALHTC
jgi:hypothetical protein